MNESMSAPTDFERVHGCLLGGAIGDALGAGIEFDSLHAIRAKHGPDGVSDFVPCYGRDVAITDDTQMTLFTAEGLAWAIADESDLIGGVWDAYIRWYDTQSGTRASENRSGLAALPEMRVARAPGNTCMSAIAGGRMGTVDEPINDSKGCGAVMRVAPVAFIAESAEEAWTLGCNTGALTHSHNCGWTSAGALSVMLWELRHGASMEAAVRKGSDSATGHTGGTEVADWIDRAVDLASGPVDGDSIDRFGAGWVGEEALAIAVLCVLSTNDPTDAILSAVNHSGDSDSTGSIVGQLLGAAYGPDVFRSEWRNRIELGDVIKDMSAQLASAQQHRLRPTSSDDHEGSHA